jgi:predicted amidohydrolase YtcJ
MIFTNGRIYTMGSGPPVVDTAVVRDGPVAFAGRRLRIDTQATRCTSDMRWAGARLGPERLPGAYAWRSLLATGTIIAGGLDFPVEDPTLPRHPRRRSRRRRALTCDEARIKDVAPVLTMVAGEVVCERRPGREDS